jgi:hypothetical protein
VTTLSIDRKHFLIETATTTIVPFLVPRPSFAANGAFQLEVMVTLPSNVDRTGLLGPDTALYVTVRPLDAATIPQELVQANGRVPPVATARVGTPNDLRLVLTESDMTPEGKMWEDWKTGALVVSARLDTDGLASTRNATDLVGRAVVAVSDKTTPTVTVPLQGRGLVGKFLTGR